MQLPTHPVPPAFQQKLDALRERMKVRRIDVPSAAQWRIDLAGQPTVVAAMDAPALELNLQHDAAAAPCFALCLAWWFERHRLLGDGPVRARVELPEGWAPAGEHGRRSAFLLHELAHLLPERFTLAPAPKLSWPAAPMLNAAIADRDSSARPEKGGEHAIEVAFTRQTDVPAQFAPIDAVEPLRRQLPLGLFDGAVSRATRWSPGGASQVDLWTRSRDGRTIHLFELKKDDNRKVGIIPEALWYARLLHRVRTRDLDGRDVAGGGPAMDEVRRAERIRMWLLVPDIHPLVLHGGDSPLAWLRGAQSGIGVSMGVLFYGYDPTTGRVELHPDRRWE
jgi:hypothetical protein